MSVVGVKFMCRLWVWNSCVGCGCEIQVSVVDVKFMRRLWV